jgi:DNA-binding MarR family transcriptional regulator
MNASDLKCAELLARIGPMTAGELAELSGLTTGAITGVVDRLMKAGWAERQPDLSDRRRVIIRPVPQDARPIEGLYEPYVQLMSGLLAEYDDQELALILDFVRRLSSVNHQSAWKIRTGME